jgi:hypothetical protein
MKLRPRSIVETIAILLTLGIPALAQTASLLPPGEQTFVDANGAPYAGGTVCSYVPNTLTPKVTWSDPLQATPNTSPCVTLDSAGRTVLYGSGTYRQRLLDLNGTLVWDKLTQDLLSLISASEWAGTSTGSANAQTLAPAAALAAYKAGNVLWFQAGLTNTSALTISTSGLPARNVFSGTGPVAPGTVVANAVYQLVDDGTEWQLVGSPRSLNVKWFGAGGSDDSGVFQAAASAAVGGSLYVPLGNGNYHIASGFTLSGATSLVFEPGAALACGGTGDCLTVSEGGGLQGQEFSNVTLVATGSAIAGTASRGLVISGSGGGGRFDNLVVNGFTAGKCVAFVGSVYDLTFSGGVLRNCSSEMFQDGTLGQISMLRVSDMLFQTDSGVGITTHTTVNLQNIIDAIFDKDHWSDAVAAGIGLDCGDVVLAASGGCIGLTVENSRFEGAFFNDLQAGFGTYSAGAACFDVHLDNNKFNGTATSTNVYYIKSCYAGTIRGGNWPGNLVPTPGPPLTGYNYVLTSAAADWTIEDQAYNSANTNDLSAGHPSTYVTQAESIFPNTLVAPRLLHYTPLSITGGAAATSFPNVATPGLATVQCSSTTNGFVEQVLFSPSNGDVVVSGALTWGTPPTRTYLGSGATLTLALDGTSVWSCSAVLVG